MALDPELQEKLLEIFQTELEEQLQVITASLLKLESRPDGDERQEALEPMMRAAHNLKGAARSVGLPVISEITHTLETLFVELKNYNLIPPAEVIDACLFAVDCLRAAMEAHNTGDELSFDLKKLLIGLEEEASNVARGHPAPARKSGKRKTRAAKTSPASSPEPAIDPEQGPELEAKANPAVAESASSQPEGQSTPIPETKSKSASTRQAEAKKPTATEAVRVSIDRLDRVSALLEEMQVAKIELDDHQAVIQNLRKHAEEILQEWNAAVPTAADDRQFADFKQQYNDAAVGFRELNSAIVSTHQGVRAKINHLGLTLTSLQDEIRVMRLVPANSQLAGLARTVRDIGRELGKDINFDVVGGETEMDRAILEKIRDPLIHLVRNAIDHGIEPPEVRKAKGKPEKGSITLSIVSEGADIAIQIKDDGGGIDTDVVARMAVKRNLVSADNIKNLDHSDLVDLIFRPGFSTKEIITDVSGRGVGMDVVRSNLQTIKGNVHVETEPGAGSTFVLRVPLTLATERGLLVKAGGQQFAIPVTAVERVLNLRMNDVVNVASGQAIVFEGQPVPLRHLADALEMSNIDTAIDDGIPVVLISAGWRTVAIVVKDVMGQQEMVIKPLKPPLISVRNVTGGTLTGKGGVVIVLNARDLVETLLENVRGNRITVLADDASEAPVHVLVVDDTLTTRTLEKNILESEGYEVDVAVNGQEAWDIFQNRHFDLVVTDVQMPLMDGFELAEKIKTDDKYREIPVIIVTSLATDEDRRRGVEVGADAYIVKSHFETRELLDVVRQLT